VHLDFSKKFFNCDKIDIFRPILVRFLQNASFCLKHLHGGAAYMQKQNICGSTMRVDFKHATLKQ